MVSLLRRLLLIYTLGLAVLIAGIVWALSTDENSCEEQWEAVRLPKEMEDLIMTNERQLTIEERERKNRAVDQMFAQIREVYSANKDLFSRQPNLIMVQSGHVGTNLPGGRWQIGLKVHVTEIVPQSKLPPEDRIPCVIDGVPIEITTAPISEYLGGATSWHRPLMAGVGIQAPNIRPVGPSVFSGTLTGLARRNSDNSEVLVTCLHNLTGAPFQDLGRLGDPLYQISTDQVKHKIGTVAGFVQMSKDPGFTNIADVAICTPINPGPPAFPEFSDFANYQLHNGDHDLGTVIAGTVDPKDVEGPLTSVSALSGVRTDVTIAALNQTPTLGGYRYSGLVRLDVGQTPFRHGDSGTPLLVEVEPGIYKMCCILFAEASSGETYAFPASVAQDELDISFGKEISMPRLSTEGFVGQRWIIDDYFRAGETLHAGDVVVFRKQAVPPYLPRAFKTVLSQEERVIGIVHTPAGKVVGDQVATTGVTDDTDEYVPVVTNGIAKAFSGENMTVGDPVAASTVRATPPGKSSMSTVVRADAQDPNIVGRCLTPMLATDTNKVVDVLVDLAGPQGAQGLQGPAGSPGRQGAPGAPGPAGPKGEKGDPGPQGPQGAPGEDGADGAPGSDGQDGRDGEGVPSYGVPDIDKYLRVGRAGVNVPVLVWSNTPNVATGPTSLRGPAGPKGDKGDKGDRGPSGPKGDRGDRGPRGYSGSDGRDGSDGQDGSDGRPGRDGSDGAQGPKGERGLRGFTGPRGPQGYTGVQGGPGEQGPPGPRGPQGPAGTCSCGGGGGDEE